MENAVAGHAALMDGVYRYQRHVYDVTRKFYLLGRDHLIGKLQPPAGGSVLEIGCGTGRNLAAAAARYPCAQLYGIDISAEMLKSAGRTLARSGAMARTRLALGDATALATPFRCRPLRPCVHFLFPVHDTGLGERAWTGRPRSQAGWQPACGRFRSAGRTAGLVQDGIACLAGTLPRDAEGHAAPGNPARGTRDWRNPALPAALPGLCPLRHDPPRDLRQPPCAIGMDLPRRSMAGSEHPPPDAML